MENNEIQIKCYAYVDQYEAILFCLFWLGLLVAFLISDIVPAIAKLVFGIAMFGSFILVVIIAILRIRLKCSTFDIYSSKGIRRIMKGKEVFNIEWDEIEGLYYYPFWGFILIRPCVLEIYLKQPPKVENKNINYWNGDNTKLISTPMSKRTLKKLAQFIPPHLLEDLKLKLSKQTPQNTDKQ